MRHGFLLRAFAAVCITASLPLSACECNYYRTVDLSGFGYYSREHEHCWLDETTGIRWVYWFQDGKLSLGNPNFNGMAYRVLEHQTAVPRGTVGKVVIPATLPVGGVQYPVTAINDYAFHKCEKMTEIVVPDCVERIGVGAFYGCNRLGKITTPVIGKDTTAANIWGIGYPFRLGENYNPSIPDTLTNLVVRGTAVLAGGAFCNMQKLCAITLEEGIRNIPRDCFNSCDRLTELTIPSTVTNVGDRAFAYCSGLKQIHLPANLLNVGECAFLDCSGLETLWLPDGCRSIGTVAFGGCTRLREIWLPAELKYIGTEAFYECPLLMRTHFHDTRAWCDVLFESNCANPLANGGELIVDGVGYRDFSFPEDATVINPYLVVGIAKTGTFEVPRSLRNVPEEAFASYDWLKTLVLPDGVTNIGARAFCGCRELRRVTLPESLKTIGDEAFLQCASLTAADLPDGVREIRPRTFSECSSLESVSLPETITNVCDSAFHGCQGLKRLTLSKALRAMGDGAFSYCTNLVEVTIPEGVAVIGSNAFAGCAALEHVTLPSTLEEIGERAFTHEPMIKESRLIGWQYRWVCERYGSLLKTVNIPANVRRIGENAFNGQSELVSALVFPSALREIGSEAFCGCKKVPSVTFAEGLVSIGYEAFAQCTAIEEVVLPSTVTNLSSGVFQGCTSLRALNIPPRVSEVPSYLCCKCPKLRSVTIPEGVKTLGYCCFEECYDLDFPKLPDSLETIGERAFASSSTYKRARGQCIRIPDGVRNICDWAFYETCCSEVEVGRGVTNIGVWAFGNSGITNITFYCDKPTIDDTFVDFGRYSGAAVRDVVFYVSRTAKGWGTIPGTLSCCHVDSGKYLSYPIYYACDHVRDAGTVVREPTVDAEGETVYACTLCHRILEREVLSPIPLAEDTHYREVFTALSPSTDAERTVTSNLAAFAARQGGSGVATWIAEQEAGSATLAARLAAAKDPVADYIFNLPVGTFKEQPQLEIKSFDVSNGFDVQVKDGDVALVIEKVNAAVSICVSKSLDGLLSGGTSVSPVCSVNADGTLHVGVPESTGSSAFYVIKVKSE